MMILEYIDGSELKGTLNTRRMLPEPEAKLIIVQVLRALAYMHDKEFVHRDVSPRNVLVNEESKRAWLIDLGLAIDLKSSNKPPAVGTLGYGSKTNKFPSESGILNATPNAITGSGTLNTGH